MQLQRRQGNGPCLDRKKNEHFYYLLSYLREQQEQDDRLLPTVLPLATSLPVATALPLSNRACRMRTVLPLANAVAATEQIFDLCVIRHRTKARLEPIARHTWFQLLQTGEFVRHSWMANAEQLALNPWRCYEFLKTLVSGQHAFCT